MPESGLVLRGPQLNFTDSQMKTKGRGPVPTWLEGLCSSTHGNSSWQSLLRTVVPKETFSAASDQDRPTMAHSCLSSGQALRPPAAIQLQSPGLPGVGGPPSPAVLSLAPYRESLLTCGLCCMVWKALQFSDVLAGPSALRSVDRGGRALLCLHREPWFSCGGTGVAGKSVGSRFGN